MLAWSSPVTAALDGRREGTNATAARRAWPLLGPWGRKEEMGPHPLSNEAGGQRKEPAENRRRRTPNPLMKPQENGNRWSAMKDETKALPST